MTAKARLVSSNRGQPQVIVVGGGASGLMAAAQAARCGASVMLVEKTKTLGNKLRLSGRGRCNITNANDLEGFVDAYHGNGKFLTNCLARFSSTDLTDFLREHGVMTKIEADGRVFPESNRADEIADCLINYVKELRVGIRTDFATAAILAGKGRALGIRRGDDSLFAGSVVIATGGKSYPRTGSTGDGYRFAGQVGHTVVPPRPALVPLVVSERQIGELQGVTCPDVGIVFESEGRVFTRQRGAVLFTHFGLSGPAVLDASSEIVRLIEKKKIRAVINVLPDLDNRSADERLRQMFCQSGSKTIANLVDQLLPKKMVKLALHRAGVSPSTKSAQITAGERQALARVLTGLDFGIVGSRPIEEAMVTSGGVVLDEVNPRTMESKVVKGLFFCGEVLDVDGISGGYNLQAAFSTGFVAGECAAKVG